MLQVQFGGELSRYYPDTGSSTAIVTCSHLHQLLLSLAPQLALLAVSGAGLHEPFADALASVTALPAAHRLHTLALSSCRIECGIAVALAATLPRLPHLVSLDMSHNKIGSEGAVALARTLPHCPSLTHLSFRGNPAFSIPRRYYKDLALGHLAAANAPRGSTVGCVAAVTALVAPFQHSVLASGHRQAGQAIIRTAFSCLTSWLTESAWVKRRQLVAAWQVAHYYRVET